MNRVLLLPLLFIAGCATTQPLDRQASAIMKRHLCLSKAYLETERDPAGFPIETRELDRQIWLIENALEIYDLGRCGGAK